MSIFERWLCPLHVPFDSLYNPFVFSNRCYLCRLQQCNCNLSLVQCFIASSNLSVWHTRYWNFLWKKMIVFTWSTHTKPGWSEVAKKPNPAAPKLDLEDDGQHRQSEQEGSLGFRLATWRLYRLCHLHSQITAICHMQPHRCSVYVLPCWLFRILYCHKPTWNRPSRLTLRIAISLPGRDRAMTGINSGSQHFTNIEWNTLLCAGTTYYVVKSLLVVHVKQLTCNHVSIVERGTAG